MSADARLSAHFSLHELTASRTAVKRGYDNTPGTNELANLRRLAAALETVREHAADGQAIIVNSGYRCPALNAAVGGVPTSNHVRGRAADIFCPRMSVEDLFERIRRLGLEGQGILLWDELIQECSVWCHFSVPADIQNPDTKTLRSTRGFDGRMVYAHADPLVPPAREGLA